jgi:S1-C subfamily serine protease
LPAATTGFLARRKRRFRVKQEAVASPRRDDVGVERQRFIHRLYVTDLEDRAVAFAGSGFAVNALGDVVTCRHVVDKAVPGGEQLRVGIWDSLAGRMHHVSPLTASYWPGLDLAVLPRAFGGQWRGDYLSLLDSDVPQVAAPVVAWGS